MDEEQHDQVFSEGFPTELSIEEKQEYLRSRNLAPIIIDGAVGLIDKDDLKEYVRAIQGKL